MRNLGRTALIALVAVFLIATLVPASLGPHASIATRAPHVAMASLAPNGRSSPSAAPSAPSAATSAPATAGCQTPGGTPNWANDAVFSQDAVVTFSVPGQPSLSGSNFNTVPCNNVIPTYENGFWMNVTTNVALQSAYLHIWGSSWPTPGNLNPDITGYGPESPQPIAMYIEPPFYHTASFYFNVYRFFWPGSQVYFNLSLTSTNATPSTIYSTSGLAIEHVLWTGGYNNATWDFYVASPFAPSPLLTSQNSVANFSQVIGVSTTPSVLSTPAYEPNPRQTIQIYLTSLNFSGPALPIPRAEATFTLSGSLGGTYYQDFGPSNHTLMDLNAPLGPYPGTRVQFNVTAWLPWEGGAIDRVYSPVYSFNWSNNGSWIGQSGGFSSNLNLTSMPDVTSPTAATSLATGTPVNITIHEPVENVTIGSSAIHFRYADDVGVTYGTLPMQVVNANTSYALIPGLPPNSGLQFSVEAKDIYGDPISSGNFSYVESGAYNVTIPPGYGLFYFEAVDLATGQLVPNLNFTIANDTWSEVRVGSPLGFAVPTPVGGVGELPVAYGTYLVTVHAFGQTQTWSGSVSSADPFVVTFYLTSQPVSPEYAIPLPSVTIAAGLGLVAASLASIPIVQWFRERRKKAEAEQRRISL
jgi:hypothetical protein